MDWEKRAGKLIDYTYDRLSNLRNIQYSNSRLIDREFDQLNLMNLIKEGEITIADMMHIGRSYRLLRKQYGNGDLIQYVYDHGSHLTTKETKNLNTNSLINKYEYGYNKVHMKTFEQRMHDNSKGDVYDYDELYRLKNVNFNVPDPTVENPTEFEKEKTFNFDKLDNILSIVENFNGQTKTITTEIPGNSNYSKLNQYATFDQWGLSYDLNGNTTQRGTQQLAYDYRNQLVTAVDAPSNTQVEMKYDVLGRRIQKSVTIGSQTKIENYYHSGQQVIEVRDENDQVLRQYIYGNGIDEIIRMDKYENGNVTSYYYHTDANGQLVERVIYDIYGMPTFWDAAGNVISKSSIGNNILFHGREYDYELNLYYYRARYYCPIMGRFLQTDPMGYADSMNLYQGFNMNPTNFTDPFGLEAWKVKNKWNQYYIKKYRDYIKKLANNYLLLGLERICEDFALSTIIEFAEIHKLPITIQNKTGIFSASSDMFNSKEAFEREVLKSTAVSDLFLNTHTIYADIKPGDFRLLQKAQPGDIMILKEGNRYNHTQVVTDIDIEHVYIHQGNIDYGFLNERYFFSFLLPIADPSSSWYVGKKIEKGRWFKISGNYQREGRPMQIFGYQGGFFSFNETQIRIWKFLDWNKEMKKKENEGN